MPRIAKGRKTAEVKKTEFYQDEIDDKLQFRAAEPLEIHLVLSNVFSHLDVGDLKSCRQTCKSWHLLATKVMKHRKVKAKVHQGNIDAFLHFKESESESDLKQVSLNDFEMDAAAAHEVLFTIPVVPAWFQNAMTLDVSLKYMTSENRHFAYDLITLLQSLPVLKNLAIHVEYLFDYEFTDWYPEPVYMLNQQGPFQLETLSITEGRKEYLSLVRPAVLWRCSKLKVLSLNLRDEVLFNYFKLSLRNFSLHWYPKNIRTISLKFPNDELLIKECDSIIKFLNYFELEDLRIHSGRPCHQWDILKLLRRLKKTSSIKNLAFEVSLPIEDLIGSERITEIFQVLGRFPKLVDLKIGIGMPQARVQCISRTFRSRSRSTNSAQDAKLFESSEVQIMSSVKSLSVKQVQAHQKLTGGPPAVLSILQAAAVSMPFLESLHVDAFHCGAVADAIKIAATIPNLTSFTINGGVFNSKVRDGTLFGYWGLKRALKKEPHGNWSVGADGLMVFQNLKSFSLYAPPGTKFTKAVFERGFLKMPGLRKLAVSAQGCVPGMAALDWGEIKFRKLDVDVMELLWDRLVRIKLP